MTGDDLDGASGELGCLRAEVARLTAELTSSQQREAALQDQMSGTASILHVIAAGPTDAHDVLQAIVDAVARLFQMDSVSFFRADGDEFERMANLESAWWAMPVGQRLPIARESWVGRALVERRTIRHDDTDAILDEEYPVTAPSYRARVAAEGAHAKPVRSSLVVPLLREGRPIGALSTARMEVRPFTDAEVDLIETFADQAVIAIENARLFEELEQRNADLVNSNQRVS